MKQNKPRRNKSAVSPRGQVKTTGKTAAKKVTHQSGMEVGKVYASVTSDGKPTKVRVLAKKKIDLDKVMI